MTAMTLNQLSNGRFIVGLGASGPQVVEGWHGVALGAPLLEPEYISIMKKVLRARHRLSMMAFTTVCRIAETTELAG